MRCSSNRYKNIVPHEERMSTKETARLRCVQERVGHDAADRVLAEPRIGVKNEHRKFVEVVDACIKRSRALKCRRWAASRNREDPNASLGSLVSLRVLPSPSYPIPLVLSL